MLPARRHHPASSRPASRLRATVAAVAGAALVATGLAVGAPLGASAAPTPVFAGGLAGTGTQTTFEPGRYIVTLADDAAATYQGGVDGLAPTKPDAGDQLSVQRSAVQSYSDYLADRQSEVASSVGASVEASYTLALNGFSSTLTADQAARLSSNKSVLSIQKDELKQPTAVPSTEFLGLEGENGVWAATGGVETAGEGVVLGVLDTGIAPENPSFAGEALGTFPSSAPYYSSPRGETRFVKSDGGVFTGVCQTGVQFTLDDCSTKVIGARYFVNGFGADRIAGPDAGEYLSPRDGDGHGSHTAGTAAGNIEVPTTVVGQDFGTITGVAPAAKIAAYKVCWTGLTSDGCATSDLISGIDAAVADGVDAINFSIGGGAATSVVDALDIAFLGAAAAGVFVSASAGNSGPGASTLDHASPWYTTVGASTIPSYEATAVLGNGEEYAGASITVDRTPGAEPFSAPLVNSTDVALAGATTPELCIAGSLDPALAEGNIVVCDRGVNDRVAKSAEVARAGGVGMLLVNVTPSSIDLDAHSVPTVHVDAQYRDAVIAYAATPDATATFLPENITGVTPPTPQIAGFSSRGPALAGGGDVLKPDITAPGVAILAAGANAEGADPSWQFLSGTSMSAPHIAGLAVLYLGESPNATPAEIKSAMMTTAYDLVDADGAPVTDPFVQGAGHVDPTRFFSPGLLYLNDLDDWLSYIEGEGELDVLDPAVEPINPSDLNLASIAIGALTAPETITRTVTSTQAGSFTPTVSGLAGLDVQVSPQQLDFASAGESLDYTVTFNRTDAALNQYATGSLTWTSGDTSVRSPVAVRPVDIVAPAEATGTGVTGSTDVTVTAGFTGEVPLTSTGLTAGTLLTDDSSTGGNSGVGVTGDSFEYLVEVPEGLPVARFDLDVLDDSTDFDLTVLQLDDAGTPVAGYQSATGSADERVTIEEPEAGTYQVFVDVYSAPEPTAFDMTSYLVGIGGDAVTFEPGTLSVEQGADATYTASWSGLDPFTRYLGIIQYGGTEAQTYLTVTTEEGEEPAPEPEPGAPVNTVPPAVTGSPTVGSTLTASNGEWDLDGLSFTYQWQVDGTDIPGATAGTYRVTAGDQGRAITAVVTASAEGVPSATATSAPVTVVYATTTALTLSRSVFFSWQRTTATVTVDTVADTAPAGTVRVLVDGRVRGEVPVEAGSDGRVTWQLPAIGRGFHSVQATFVPADATVAAESQSRSRTIWVIF